MKILITGGTGSLGNAFTEYALRELPIKALRILSRDERKQAEMAARIGDDRLRLLLGDVRDRARLRRAFQGVDIVIHAAALKRVDAVAYDPIETIQTNVLGSVNVVEAAVDAGVSLVLGISTDKGCLPANLYGATKATMERLFTYAGAYAGGGPTKFACTRYGNVIGSRGSVLEVWREQFARQGFVTVTDTEMTRFWLTLDEACVIVRQAVEGMRGGEVFVPSLRRAPVLDLLEAYFGHVPAYVVSGLRHGGEKLHEDLLSTHEASGPWPGAPGGYIVSAAGCASGLPDLTLRSCDPPFETVDVLRRLLVQAGCVK